MKALTAGQRISSKLAVATFVSVFLLILVGATVRITGAGMGCPDWPTCYGKIIPPTDISQLPENYKEIYKKPGFEVADFNPLHTWTEYLNRLFSAVITGPVAIAFAISSFAWWKRDRSIVFFAFAILLMIGFQAWLGPKVVDTGLKSAKITAHLLGAMFILTLSLFAAQKTIKAGNPGQIQAMPKHFSVILHMGFFLLLVQIISGTFVRGEMEAIAELTAGKYRSEWLNGAMNYFSFHWIFSLAVLGSYIWLCVKMLQAKQLFSKGLFAGLFIGILGQVITALSLVYVGYPAVAQLLHLAFAMILFSCHIYLLGRQWLSAKTANVGIDLKKVNFA